MNTLYLPWQFLLYMSTAVVAGVATSFVTSSVRHEKLDRFYMLSRTPIAPSEEIVEPCVLPARIVPAQKRMLMSLAGLEIPRPSRTSLVGFAAIWICVFVMIGVFMWVVSAGKNKGYVTNITLTPLVFLRCEHGLGFVGRQQLVERNDRYRQWRHAIGGAERSTLVTRIVFIRNVQGLAAVVLLLFPAIAIQAADSAKTVTFHDLNGTDIWRNEGRVVHVRFVQDPTRGSRQAMFTVRKRYETCAGQPSFVEVWKYAD